MGRFFIDFNINICYYERRKVGGEKGRKKEREKKERKGERRKDFFTKYTHFFPHTNGK